MKAYQKTFLRENLNWNQANITLEESVERDDSGKPKNLYMKGIFIEGEIKNHNNRIYPFHEISRAVNQLKECINRGETVYGEADHPEGLTINLDRVSHIVEDISLQGTKGVGKLRIIPTPLGTLVRTIIESGGKLGVSSRGSGNVDDYGKVSDFEIVTIDIVARPSAPNAYPTPIYERLMNFRNNKHIIEMAHVLKEDKIAQKHFKSEIIKFMDDLFKK
ncbi:MAG: hypothetical protein NZZ41_00560 [Candidatus Dojkabacteria bacterium]|nr:hypothetical protein [Candidatus Dojkabacteria bacterium]